MVSQKRQKWGMLLDQAASSLPHLCEHAGGLRAAHDGDAAVGPGEQEVRAVCAPAHGVVARAVAAPDDHRDLGHLRLQKKDLTV